MPAICETLVPISTKLTENLTLGFKKSEKENYESHPHPTVSQVLSAKIEYEEVPNSTNSTLATLQAKYILLKPNQTPLTLAASAVHTNSKISQQNKNENGSSSSSSSGTTTNERNVNTINGSTTSALLASSSAPSLSTTTSSSSVPAKLPQPKKVLFQKEKIEIGWNQYGLVKSWGSGCGFNNIGNTCYLNSALQAFFHVPAVAQWLISDREHRDRSNCKDTGQCIICAMAITLLNTQKNNSSFTPSNITNRLSQICKHLTLGRQEDAHEFLRYLIEKMEKSFLYRFRGEPWFKDLDQHSKETTPLSQILGGYLRSTVTCLSCYHESITFQHFQDLAIDISRVATLGEAISGFFSRENLEECGYKCEACKKRVPAAKKFSVERLPVVLCIQFKRFTALGGKLSKHIQISERLSLQKYLSKQSDPHQGCSYRLVSMVTHLGGSASGGHYTAVGMSPNGSYYHFDDSRVSSISLDNVLRGNSYVIFYELVRESKHQNEHSILHENGHNYTKPRHSLNGSSLTSSSSTSALTTQQNQWRPHPNFSTPSLPKMVPSNVMKQQQQMKQSPQLQQQQQQKQQQQQSINQSQSPKNGVKPPSNGWNTNGKISPGIIKMNGNNSNNKKEMPESEHESKNDTKKFKSNPLLPSVPRLLDTDTDVKSPTKANALPSPSVVLNKPRSLVPAYGTDDEDDDEGGKKETQTKICRTSSGIFIESDFKENDKFPSKQGSTIVTKASVALVSTKSEPVQMNGKHPHSNGHSNIDRTDDAISQLTKLNHNGYGASNVISWNNTPTSMNREVSRDQQEDRKRQYESDGDIDMDRGRTKKLKYNSGQYAKQKLPNPFSESQNALNHQNNYERYNGNNNERMMTYNGGSRPYHNNNNKGFLPRRFNGKDGHKPFYNNNNNRNNNNHHHHRGFNNARR